MTRVLVSAGCSMAWGMGLRHANDKYAKVIASQYGMDFIDVSCAGASNEHIASCGVYGVHQALLKHKAEDVVLLVGWTEQPRVEYWDVQTETIKSAMVQRRLPPELENVKEYVDEDVLFNIVRRNMWSPGFSYYKLLHAFNYLNSFCDSREVRVINVANLSLYKIKLPPTRQRNTLNNPSFFTENVLTERQQAAFDSLFKKDCSFGDLIQAGGRTFCISETDLHPNDMAHYLWAERIINENKDILGT